MIYIIMYISLTLLLAANVAISAYQLRQSIHLSNQQDRIITIMKAVTDDEIRHKQEAKQRLLDQYRRSAVNLPRRSQPNLVQFDGRE